ncbi:MAG TPA: hypothetical protein VKZ18_29320 [Polyangia bacterium]|nr:hypothetical protein [Polyangia bacterium]
MATTRQRVSLRGGALLLAFVLWGGACATAIYPGPRRPSSELAIIAARDLVIDEIDGIDVSRKGLRFEVLPGDHMMVVELAKVTHVATIPLGRAWLSVGSVSGSGPMPFCVSAQRNHSYMVVPRSPGAVVQPIIYDETPNRLVPPCGPAAAYHRDDFPCEGALAEETLVSGVQKVSGCGVENVYGYDPAPDEWQSVTERATFDLNCPGQQLAVHHLGGAAVSVVGCGMRADYVANAPCVHGLCTFQGWVPNTAPPR